MEFVVNEWLPQYFKPDASIEEKQKLELFLNKFLERKDKIFVRRPSEFLRKIHRFKKDYQYNIKTYNEIGKFINLILLDSDRCFFVDDDEFKLSEAIINKLVEGGNTVSDTYLFEAASATKNKLILTTDMKLKTFMANEETFRVELLDDFLEKY
ncbi:MAG TPA: hypothetical protein VGP55_00170 [Chitinophagaceae bacterium]|nr:hypothetical protein [Chitinophagaceae bacterium]